MTGPADAAIPTIGGDPPAIRESASRWDEVSRRYDCWAGEVRSCRRPDFDGDEGVQFNATLGRYGDDLDRASQAWSVGAAALGEFADRLEWCQGRLASLSADIQRDRAEIGELLSATHGVCDATVHDVRMGSWASEFRAVRFEHDEAMRTCRAGLAAAQAFIPRIAATPSGRLHNPCSATLRTAWEDMSSFHDTTERSGKIVIMSCRQNPTATTGSGPRHPTAAAADTIPIASSSAGIRRTPTPFGTGITAMTRRSTSDLRETRRRP